MEQRSFWKSGGEKEGFPEEGGSLGQNWISEKSLFKGDGRQSGSSREFQKIDFVGGSFMETKI